MVFKNISRDDIISTNKNSNELIDINMDGS